MNPQEQLWLAAQIYSFKVVLQPDWDLQKHARESFRMATQFFLAVQAERAGSSTDSHQTSSDSPGSQDTSSSEPHPQSGSTTHTPKPQSAKDWTAGAGSGSETAPPADTGSSHKQSQEQSSRSIQETPYAPYYPHFSGE